MYFILWKYPIIYKNHQLIRDNVNVYFCTLYTCIHKKIQREREREGELIKNVLVHFFYKNNFVNEKKNVKLIITIRIMLYIIGWHDINAYRASIVMCWKHSWNYVIVLLTQYIFATKVV